MTAQEELDQLGKGVIVAEQCGDNKNVIYCLKRIAEILVRSHDVTVGLLTEANMQNAVLVSRLAECQERERKLREACEAAVVHIQTDWDAHVSKLEFQPHAARLVLHQLSAALEVKK